MACYYPLEAWRSVDVNKSGKRSMTFDAAKGFGSSMPIPCGRCIGCKLEYSRQWALRCMCEAAMHEENCFITLTYEDKFLPLYGSLVPSDLTKFWKRYRKFMDGEPIQYFACGEYGEEKRRPHYHACVFGMDFPDKYHFRTVNGVKYYRSGALERLWPFGQSLIGDVTFESAAYVARYVCHKLNVEGDFRYEYIDLDTAEVFPVEPEFVRMSLKRPIGKSWYEKYKDDVYPSDFMVSRGVRMKPPKYFDKQLDEATAADVKLVRRAFANAHRSDNTPERLAVRRAVKEAQVAMLKREVE